MPANSKAPTKKKGPKIGADLVELPSIKKKEGNKKMNTFGKSGLFGKKKKTKYVSPYMKQKKTYQRYNFE